MATVYFRGGHAEAAQVVQTVLRAITGASNGDTVTIARGVFYAIGFAALGDIQADFVVKARGGVGLVGGRWAPLSKKYLAYQRRFGPGEKTALKAAAGLNRAHAFAPGGKSGLLTKAQLKLWRKQYAFTLARLAVNMPYAQAKARAAAIAWNILKREHGAQTKLEVFGNRQVEILRDTGVLLNSLSMGHFSGGDSYSPPSGEGGDQQIFEPLLNGIIVGTRVRYARAHNEGYPKRNLPERRFIPRDNQIPQQWLDNWMNVGLTAIANGIVWLMQSGGGRR